MCIMCNKFSPVGTYRQVSPFHHFGAVITAWRKEEGKRQSKRRKRVKAAFKAVSHENATLFCQTVAGFRGEGKAFLPFLLGFQGVAQLPHAAGHRALPGCSPSPASAQVPEQDGDIWSELSSSVCSDCAFQMQLCSSCYVASPLIL